MPTPEGAKPETTRHRINEVPGRTTPAPGQPEPKLTPTEKRAQLADLKDTIQDIEGQSKVDQMIEAMERPQGASMAYLVEMTGWKDHSVRAFIARNLKKKRGLDIVHGKVDGQDGRVYRIEKAAPVALEDIEEAI